LRGEESSFLKVGARLVILGNGSPQMARAFVEDLGLPKDQVFTDPSRKSYALAGMKRGVLATFNPKSILHAARAMKAGFRQTKTAGDPLQQGGVVVVEKGGMIRFVHQDSEAGDLAPLAQVLAAVGSLGAK
jgi:hypothetical protein